MLRPARLPLLAAWLCALAALLLLAAPARADVAGEYQLKAAYLFNFSKFVEWQPDRFADETSPIVVGVLGGSPLAAELEAVVSGRTVNGRAIEVLRPATAAEARAAHIVFVGSDLDSSVAEILSALSGPGVLTVGESRAFSGGGGIVTLINAGDRVRFEIDQAAGERAGLRISAQLLKLATVVRGRRN